MSDEAYKYTLTRKDVAELLGVSTKTITKYIQTAHLPYEEVTGKRNLPEYRFSKDEVLRWDIVKKTRSERPVLKKDMGSPGESPASPVKKGDVPKGERDGNVARREGGVQKEKEKERVFPTSSALDDRLTQMYERQILGLEKVVSTLENQLESKDLQIEQLNIQFQSLQDNYHTLLSIHQITSKRLEAPLPIIEDPYKSDEPVKTLTDLMKRKVVKQINKLSKKGLTSKQIAKSLNDKGSSTFSGRGVWHARSIRKILSEKKDADN